MVTLFLIIFIYILTPFALAYFAILCLFGLISAIGFSLAFVIPVVIVILFFNTISFIIKNKNILPKNKLRSSLAKRIIFSCCGVLYLIFTLVQTNDFNDKLQGKSFTCSYDELGYLGFIFYTYETISFDSPETCSLYRYKRQGEIEDRRKELPGEKIGDYKYTLIRLINGDYAVIVNKHIYSIKADNNEPDWISHSALAVF